MWVWALRGSRHFEPAAYSVRLHWPHRAELIIVSLGWGHHRTRAFGSKSQSMSNKPSPFTPIQTYNYFAKMSRVEISSVASAMMPIGSLSQMIASASLGKPKLKSPGAFIFSASIIT